VPAETGHPGQARTPGRQHHLSFMMKNATADIAFANFSAPLAHAPTTWRTGNARPFRSSGQSERVTVL
jgi:hypothetical protein